MVYLIAQPSVSKNRSFPDLSPLAEFGEIKIIIEAGEYPASSPDKALADISQRLANFDAEEDYIAWAGGDTLAALLTGSVLYSMGHRRIRWMRFDRKRLPGGIPDSENGYYSPVTVDMPL